MSECLYCGRADRGSGPVKVCVCGRSGSWQAGYSPKLIECEPQFDTPEWLRFLRRLWYEAHPVNAPIIARAHADTSR